MTVLALNCGSSSLKYAVFDGDAVVARGSVDRIGAGGARDHAAAVHALLDDLPPPQIVGHRVVHGGDRFAPQLVDAALVAALEAIVPLAPLHLPIELRAIAAVRERYGDAVPQLVCFDTGFHRTLPEMARRYALPSSLFDAGVRRYGFHGLSYEYVVSTLAPTRLRRAILAHLGNGASMVAVRDGVSVDTTMGFTPAGGLVMGTRPGDLDPGVLVYLLAHGYDAKTLDHLVNHESGLRALSGTTSDMEQLLAERAADPRAALAVELFCYQARKSIGALAAVLGGIETLVFTGGIGEHAFAVRSEICRDLQHLGIVVDETRNRANDASIGAGSCAVFVIRTDEERMIGRHAAAAR